MVKVSIGKMQPSRLGRLPEHFGKRDGLQDNYNDPSFSYESLLFGVENEFGNRRALDHMQYTFGDNYGEYEYRKVTPKIGNRMSLNITEEDEYGGTDRQTARQFKPDSNQNYLQKRSPERQCHGGLGEDRCAAKKMRRRRYFGGGRLACEPYMLPYNTRYYPCGFFGPCVQLCPYVPIMSF